MAVTLTSSFKSVCANFLSSLLIFYHHWLLVFFDFVIAMLTFDVTGLA